ncbi:MAG: TonB-dependent receptor [Emcibacter sp.]|nr:TonB-dependent receptor [Emcibacter sp.]
MGRKNLNLAPINTVKKITTIKKTTLIAGVSALTLTVFLPASFAAKAAEKMDSAIFEDIVVTATKRGAQSLLDVPISIQAITGENLKNRGVQDFADWAVSVPGLRYEDLGPGDKRIFLRGVNSIGASTTGVYFDEAVINGSNKEDGGGRNVDIKLYDIEQIEILKGPQGTLYGASSMAGTIKMISKKPNLNGIDAYVDGTIGNTDNGGFNWGVNAMINIPIMQDKIGLRVVVWNDDKSGYIDNVRLGKDNINDEQTYGGRVMLRLAASEHLTVDAAIMIQRTEVGGTSRVTPPGTIGHIPTNDLPTFQGGDLRTVSFTNDVWDDDWEIYSLTAQYSMDHGTITATTNWFDRDLNFNFDSTPILLFFGVPIPAITHQPQTRRIWSNELRYASDWEGPLQLVIGGLIQREKTNFEVQVIATDPLTGDPLGPWDPDTDALAGTGNAFFGRTNIGSLNQEAIFGELSYELSEKLTATVGLRYFHSRQKSTEVETHPFGGFLDDDRPDPDPNDASENKLTTKFNLSYKLNENSLLFATASQGFRVGGLNAASLPFISAVPRNFGPDSLWNYEIGFKTNFSDKKVLLNVSIFQIDWKDMQSASKDATGAFQFIANAGQARIRGIELDMTARPVENFEFSIGGAYTDAKLVQDQPGVTPGNDIEVTFPGHKGDPIPNVPEFTFNAAAQYNFAVRDDIGGLARIDYSWIGKSRTEFRPRGATDDGFNPFTQNIGGYSNLNARLGLETENWSANLFINNIFDTRGIVDAISSDQDPLSHLVTRPRTYGLNVTWHR